MDLGLHDKTVLVTGASGVIGSAIARAFAAEGAVVAIGYHSGADAAKRTADDVTLAGGRPLLVHLDLADPASLDQAVATVEAEAGGVDVLVNNAVAWGSFPASGELFETTPPERMRASLDANLYGQYLLTRAAVGSMRRRGWGRVAHISSGLVEDGMPGSAPYVTAKAGLHGLTRTMSRELAHAGILTNLVMSGFVVGESKRMPQSIVDKAAAAAATGRTTRAEEVASLVVYLCSDANGHVTGELIRADGHFLAPA